MLTRTMLHAAICAALGMTAAITAASCGNDTTGTTDSPAGSTGSGSTASAGGASSSSGSTGGGGAGAASGSSSAVTTSSGSGGSGGTAGSAASAGSGGAGGATTTGTGGSGGGPPLQSYAASYIGGPGALEQLRGTTLDAQGNLYFAGGAYSTNLAGCAGAHQGDMDAIAGKVAPDGSLLWCRYIGGTGYDRFYDIEINAAQTQVIVAGRSSAGFPVTPGKWDTTFDTAQPGCGGPYAMQDGAVCALDAASGNVAWCTYTGFSAVCDFIRTIALDASDAIILGTGVPNAVTDPQYAGKFLNGPGGGMDGIIGKLSADGSTLLWYRYVGGTGDSAVEGMVAVDSAGIYYAPAWTRDANHTVIGGFDTTFSGGNQTDQYLARLTLDGATITYATYVGGSAGDDTGMHGLVATATPGVIFLKAGTQSADWPTTPGAFSPVRKGPSDCGVVKIDTNQTGAASLLAGTYLGGSANDFCEGSGLVPGGGLVLSGSTNSTDFPVTANGQFKTHSSAGADDDGFVAILSSDLTSVVYGSYAGGPGIDSLRAVAADSVRIGAVGHSISPSFPTTPGTYQPVFSGGDYDGIFAFFPR